MGALSPKCSFEFKWKVVGGGRVRAGLDRERVSGYYP